MEITWDRIQALGKRLNDSRDLEIALEVGSRDYLVFTPEAGRAHLQLVDKNAKGRTHRVTATGLWDLVCDCPDFLYNGELNMGWCKHLMAVMEYRGHTPVLVKTLADGNQASTEPEPNSSGELWSSDPTYLEHKIKELY